MCPPEPASPASLSLPADAVLIHVGPFKTGTTAIQASLSEHRDDLADHGVWYPGPAMRLAREVWSLRGGSPRGYRTLGPEVWEEFVAQVPAHPGRIALSAEEFVTLRSDRIGKLVADLGPDRVHIVMVARRLEALIPSSWQEWIKSTYGSMSYEQYVEDLMDPASTATAAVAFWHSHDIGAVLRRWREHLPGDRITVLVADEGDRERLARVLEEMLDLPGGLLRPGQQENASLTWARTEMYRRLNDFFAAHDWGERTWRRMMRQGVMQGLMSAPRGPGEAPIPPVPAVARDWLARLSAEREQAVRDAGVRVLGDPAALRFTAAGATDRLPAPPTELPIDAAVAAVSALVEVSVEEQEAIRERVRSREVERRRALKRDLRRAHRRAQRQAVRRARRQAQRRAQRRAAAPAVDPLAGVSSTDLLGEIARRQGARLRRTVRRRR
ncbi:MAG: hypothetical protein QM638_06270 [Nocardioides sp.]|uniref:hypothetical protein n=1 Tax=Nocardioides sp. TaxID=35761 RepID=UPI0039E24002